MAITFFYAVGTAIGGVMAPAIFGTLIATKQPLFLFYGYLLGAILIASAGIVEIFFGVNAERKSLEDSQTYN